MTVLMGDGLNSARKSKLVVGPFVELQPSGRLVHGAGRERAENGPLDWPEHGVRRAEIEDAGLEGRAQNE